MLYICIFSEIEFIYEVLPNTQAHSCQIFLKTLRKKMKKICLFIINKEKSGCPRWVFCSAIYPRYDHILASMAPNCILFIHKYAIALPSHSFVYASLRAFSSWSPNSTDLYFWYLFVELAVVTPVERRILFRWLLRPICIGNAFFAKKIAPFDLL